MIVSFLGKSGFKYRYSIETQHFPRQLYDLQVKYISKIWWHHWLHGGLKGLVSR